MNFKLLTDSEIFCGVSETEIRELLRTLGAYEKRFSKNEIIYHAGEKVSDLGIVLSGGVNITVNYYHGGSGIFGHIAPGQLFAEAYSLTPARELLCDAVADSETDVLFINSAALLAKCAAKDSLNQITLNLLRISSMKNINLSTRMIHISSRLIRERILSYLSEQAAINQSSSFTIPFSQSRLAEYLGVERSALSGELSKMRREGLIDYKKNSFRLL